MPSNACCARSSPFSSLLTSPSSVGLGLRARGWVVGRRKVGVHIRARAGRMVRVGFRVRLAPDWGKKQDSTMHATSLPTPDSRKQGHSTNSVAVVPFAFSVRFHYSCPNCALPLHVTLMLPSTEPHPNHPGLCRPMGLREPSTTGQPQQCHRHARAARWEQVQERPGSRFRSVLEAQLVETPSLPL